MEDRLGSIISYDDYYAFGLYMPGRSGRIGDAAGRYKFTGKERDVETGFDYFGARYYDSRIGRWMAVDAINFPSWSPYSYACNNPIRIFDPDGNKGWDVTKFLNNIHNVFYYARGGKNPDRLLCEIMGSDFILPMTELLRLFETTSRALRMPDWGYDCSGVVCAANNANPDASYKFDADNMRIADLWNHFESHKECYTMFTDPEKLEEGDFLLKKTKSHGYVIIRDPETGELVAFEAPQTGRRVGRTRPLKTIIKNLKKDYVGFHDKGNDPDELEVKNIKDYIESTQKIYRERGFRIFNGSSTSM